MKKIISSILVLYMIALTPSYGKATGSTLSSKNRGAVVLLFHRFNENKYPTTNIRTEQLDDMIKYIKDEGFTVVPLPQVVEALKSGSVLPPKAIAITIDDAFKSAYTVAFPKFSEAGIPFTIFVSTQNVNAKNPNYMTWDNLAEMSNAGVDIQNHTNNHPHMVGKEANTLRQEIETSQTDIAMNTGIVPTLFAYPYGEADLEVMEIAKNAGFKASFGQYSGVANATSDMYYLPRFAINESYGTLKRLKLVLNTKPLPVISIQPNNPLITNNNPPQIQFTVSEKIKSLKGLACYQSNVGKVSLEVGNKTAYLDFTKPFKKGRTRINCTIRHPQGGYRWYGFQYFVQ